MLPFVLGEAREQIKVEGRREEGRGGKQGSICLCISVRKPSSAVSTALSSSTSGCVKFTDIDFDCNFKSSDCVKRGELYG